MVEFTSWRVREDLQSCYQENGGYGGEKTKYSYSLVYIVLFDIFGHCVIKIYIKNVHFVIILIL